MNANIKSVIFLTAGLILLGLASCSNPSSGARFTAQPETGIDTDDDAGLVAGLPLEGDAILSNPDVLVSGTVSWEEGLSGNAMRGDEDGDYLRILDGTLPELTLQGTVKVWIYPDSPAGEDNKWAGILHKGVEADFSDEAWSIQYQGRERAMFNYHYLVDGANKYKSVTATITLSEGAWHLLAVTWECDEATGDVTLKIYLDGVLNNTRMYAGIGPMMDSDGDLIVGSQLPSPYNGTYGHLTFMGLIDEVSVYDHARTAEEIRASREVYFPAG